MRYIEISQTILSQMPMPYHIEAVEPALEGVSHRGTYVTEFEERPKRARWGTGLFQIEDDGSLTLIDSDWDTSD